MSVLLSGDSPVQGLEHVRSSPAQSTETTGIPKGKRGVTVSLTVALRGHFPVQQRHLLTQPPQTHLLGKGSYSHFANETLLERGGPAPEGLVTL